MRASVDHRDTSSTSGLTTACRVTHAGRAKIRLASRLPPSAGEEAVPQSGLLVDGAAGNGARTAATRGDRAHHRGTAASRSGSPPSAATPSQSAQTSRRRRLQRAAAGVAEEPLQRMAAPGRRRAGRLQHGRRDLHRGLAGEQLGPPHPAVRLRLARRRVDPAGRLEHHQPGRGDRGVRPADPGPHRRQAAQPALGSVRRPPRRPPPARRPRTRPRSWRPATAASPGRPAAPAPRRRRAGRPPATVDVQVQVVAAGRAHARGRPRSARRCTPAPGRDQELRDRAGSSVAARGHQVGVGVPGAGDERLRALDPVPAAGPARTSVGELRQPANRRRARSSPPRSSAPSAAAASTRSRIAKKLSGTPSAASHLVRDLRQRAGDRGVHVEHQRGRAVAGAPAPSRPRRSRRSRRRDRRAAPAPSARAARRRAGRRSRPRGTSPATSCSAARAASTRRRARAATRRRRTAPASSCRSSDPLPVACAPTPGTARRSTGSAPSHRVRPAAQQPARATPSTDGPDAAQPQRRRRAGRTRPPARPGRRTAPGRGCPAAHPRHPLGHRHREEPRASAVAGDRVEHQRAAGRSTRHASATARGRSGTCSRISPATTTSAHAVGERQRAARRRVPAARRARRPAAAPSATGRRRRAGSPCRDVRRQQASRRSRRRAARRPVAARRRDQRGPRRGDPVQHRERPARVPPLVPASSSYCAGSFRDTHGVGHAASLRGALRYSRAWKRAAHSAGWSAPATRSRPRR